MNFLEALNTPVSDVEAPKLLPIGTYHWKITKAPIEGKIDTPDFKAMTISFPVVPFAAEEDVDPDELAEFGDLKGGVNRVQFIFPTEDDRENDVLKAQNYLKDFLTETLMLDTSGNPTLKELMDKSPGSEFIAVVKWQPNKNRPDENFVNLSNMMPLE